MTAINTETGELLESLTEDQARRLTDRIRLLGHSLADTLDKLADLIDQARTGSAWLALGYRSWTEYVAEEFTDLLPRLGREPRAEFVRELAARGMSTRAIAPVVGISDRQAAYDAASTPVQKCTPETPEAETVPALSTEQATTPSGTAASRPPVTGLDGKRYSRPEPVATQADLNTFVADQQTVQDSTYLLNVLKAVRTALAVTTFDAERVGRIADESDLMALDALATSLASWHERVLAQRTGLRLVKGDVR